MRSVAKSRPVRWFTISMVLALGALIAWAEPAFAHDKFVGSSPTDKATVQTVPSRVTIRFEEPPGTGFSGITVTGPDGKNIGIGVAKIIGSTLTIPVKKTTIHGLFTVRYHIISDDGHPVSGILHFTVGAKKKPAASSQAAQPAAVPAAKTGTQGADHGWIAIVGGALAILGLTGLIAKRTNTMRD